MKLKYLIYGFTSFSVVQLIGYLGTAYTWLTQPMIILYLVLILLSLTLGVGEWTKAQSQQIAPLTPIRILSSFAGSLTLIVLITFALAVGTWIAL